MVLSGPVSDTHVHLPQYLPASGTPVSGAGAGAPWGLFCVSMLGDPSWATSSSSGWVGPGKSSHVIGVVTCNSLGHRAPSVPPSAATSGGSAAETGHCLLAGAGSPR